jgi:hypothetical protein
MNQLDVLNPMLEGKLIFAFRHIREVALIELRNGFRKIPELNLLFYIDRMGKSIISNNVNLKRFELVKKIATKYAIYDLFYSLEDESSICDQLEGKYDYFIISYSDSIVNDYHIVKREFELKCKSGNFCKISLLDDLLNIYREHFKIVEVGKLVA